MGFDSLRDYLPQRNNMNADGTIYVEDLILYLLECSYSVADIEKFLHGLSQICDRDRLTEDATPYDIED